MAYAHKISPEDLVGILTNLAKDNNLQATVKQSLKGGVIAGTGATLGGLLAGPLGIAVGASVGGLLGAWSTSGTFKPVHSILQDLSEVEKEKLYRCVMLAIGDAGLLDLASLAVLIATDQAYKQQAIGAVTEFLKNEFQMEVME